MGWAARALEAAQTRATTALEWKVLHSRVHSDEKDWQSDSPSGVIIQNLPAAALREGHPYSTTASFRTTLTHHLSDHLVQYWQPIRPSRRHYAQQSA